MLGPRPSDRVDTAIRGPRSGSQVDAEGGDPEHTPSCGLDTPLRGLRPGVEDEHAGRPVLLAPFGLDDLLGLVMRPTPHASNRPDRLAAYRRRVETKNWLALWPKVRVILG